MGAPVLTPEEEVKLAKTSLHQWVYYIGQLDKDPIHGRCKDCSGAMTAHDAKHNFGMHVACANAKYGED